MNAPHRALDYFAGSCWDPVLESLAGFCSNRQVSENFAGCGLPRAPESCDRGRTVRDLAKSCDRLPEINRRDSRTFCLLFIIIIEKAERTRKIIGTEKSQFSTLYFKFLLKTLFAFLFSRKPSLSGIL